MRIFVVFSLIPLFLAGTLSVHAAPATQVAPAGAEDGPSRLDTLFSELKRERNEKAAERIARQIGAQWMDSGSASVDLMMQWANKAISEKKFDVALDFLDQVIVLQPGYAEGWNRRATVHFMMDNYAKSMSDIAQTLALEPRHFGAIAGMAQIFKAAGNDPWALDAYEEALDVYPMLRNAQSEVVSLADELAGEGI